MIKLKQIKTYLYLIFSVFLLASIIFPNMFTSVFADDEKLVNEAKSETGGDVANLIEKVKGYDFEKEDKITSVLTYMFSTGHYMENVDRGVLGSKVDETVVHNFNGHKSICGFDNEPQNLLNHNCDIPTLTTALAQRFSDLGALQGMQNAGTTTAKAPFGLGIPSGLPNDKVPANPKERRDKFTALELYGYNLQYTNYNGEWDNIEVSTEARLLSNFGFFNHMQLIGSMIFESFGSAFMTLFKDFNWNPLKWFANVVDAGSSAALWTIIDTSDLNVASTHKWKRPAFASTVYNAHYLSDKEIVNKAQEDFFEYFKSELEARAMKKPDIKKVFRLKKDSEEWPVFVYDPHVETEASIKAREAAEAHNAANPKNPVPVPEPVYETEEEQFARWKKDDPQASYYAEAKGVGIPCPDKSTYGAVRECWDEPWLHYAKKKIKNNDPTIQQIIKDIEDDFSNQKPHYDPNRSIAHWVCANENGELDEKIKSFEHLYKEENTREGETLNSSCSPVRPSIQGGLYGTGLGEKGITDTRWKMFKRFQSNPNFAGTATIWRPIARGITIVTNTLLSLSFSNILTALQIPKLVEKVVTAFRDSFFFQLSVLGAAAFGLFVMLKLFKDFSMVNAFTSIGYLLFVFIICGAILTKPHNMTKAIEEVPTAIDNFLAEAVLGSNPDDQSSSQKLCSNSGGKYNAVRSMACYVWEINIFTPWVQGQWGTTFENLDSDKLSNQNSDLVGDASVDMGNGSIMNNWAIFQLSKMKSGSITDVDRKSKEGVIQKGLYKLVDLQAGPNNGEKSDARYLETWSGITGKRDSYAFRSMLISIAMLILIGGFAVLKIETSLMFALLLMISPIMATVALFPGGKRKFIEYLGELARLFVQRVFITLILLITLLMLKTVISTSNYNTIFVFVLVLAVTTRMYYKDIINMLTGGAKSGFGLEMGELTRKAKHATPQTISRKFNMFKRGTAEATAGAVGGGVAGVINSIRYAKDGVTIYDHDGKKVNPFISSVKQGASDGWRRGSNFEFNKQRRAGFGSVDQLFIASEDAIKAINKENADNSSKLRVTTASLKETLKKDLNKTGDKVNQSYSQFKKKKEELVEFVNNNQDVINSQNMLGKEHIYQAQQKLQNELSILEEDYRRFVYDYTVQKSAITLVDKLAQNNFQNLPPELNRILRSYNPGQKFIVQDESGKMVYSKNELMASKQFMEQLTKYAYDVSTIENYSIRDDIKSRFIKKSKLGQETDIPENVVDDLKTIIQDSNPDEEVVFDNIPHNPDEKHHITDEEKNEVKVQRKTLLGLGKILDDFNPLDKPFVVDRKKGLMGSLLSDEDTHSTLFGNDTDKLNQVLAGDTLPDKDATILAQDFEDERDRLFNDDFDDSSKGIDKYFNKTAEEFSKQESYKKIYDNNFEDEEVFDFSSNRVEKNKPTTQPTKPIIDLEDDNSVSNLKGKEVTTLREELQSIEESVRNTNQEITNKIHDKIIGEKEEQPLMFRNLNQNISVNNKDVITDEMKEQFDKDKRTTVKAAEVLVEDVIQNTENNDLLKENEYFRNSMTQMFMLADSIDETTKPKIDSVNTEKRNVVINEGFKEIMANIFIGKKMDAITGAISKSESPVSSKGRQGKGVQRDSNTGTKEFKSRRNPRNRGGRR